MSVEFKVLMNNSYLWVQLIVASPKVALKSVTFNTNESIRFALFYMQMCVCPHFESTVLSPKVFFLSRRQSCPYRGHNRRNTFGE